MNPLEHLAVVLQYIADHEREDFEQNPSRTHVYFSYLSVQEGEIAAENAYQQARDEQEKPITSVSVVPYCLECQNNPYYISPDENMNPQRCQSCGGAE